MVLEEDLSSIIKDHTRRFSYGFKEVHLNRSGWDELHKRVKHIFEKAIEQCVKYHFYENVFTVDYKSIHLGNTNIIDWKFIQLSLGNHPIGMEEKTYGDYGNLKESKLISEKGGTLSIAQDVSGRISIIIFPSYSEVLKYGDEYIIYKLYRRPSDVKDKDIWNAIKFLLIFSLHTSFVSQISPFWWYRIRISWRKFRSKKNAHKLGKIAFELLKESISIMAKVYSGKH